MGLYGIAEVKMVKDNWNVEWKIEDETIAKCVPESGIENNDNKKDNTVSNRKLATTGENNLVILAISATVIAVVILGIKIKKSI